MTEQQRFPLSWPAGWKRTPYGQRRRAMFHKVRRVQGPVPGTSYQQKESLDLGDGLKRLEGELRRLGAQRVVISSNLQLTQDGRPYTKQAKMLNDPGVAVYFTLKGQPRALACDQWQSAAENMAAIAGHIEAIRACDRYGVGTLEQAFAGYAALPANTAHNWRAVFGLGDDVRDLARVDERYRELARTAHPDVGGSHDAMARLSEARAAARQELGA